MLLILVAPDGCGIIDGPDGGLPEGSPRRHVRVLLLIIAVVLLSYLVKDARIVFIPTAIALLGALLAWPLRAWLTRYMAGWIAASVVCVLVALGVALLVIGGWWVGTIVVRQASDMQSEVSTAWQSGVQWLKEFGLPSRWLPPETLRSQDWASVGMNGEIWSRFLNFINSGFGSLLSLLVILGLAAGMFVFLMLEIPRWDAKASELFGADAYCRTRDSFTKSAMQLRRYLLAKTISGVACGVLTTILCWAMGVPLAVMWGVLSIILNYIPNVGSFITGIPLSLLALLTLDAGNWLIFMALLLTIEATTSNILDPLVQGNVMLLSPFQVMVALLFWTWMWGVAGAFLAVPLSAAIVVALRHAYQLRPVGKFLSD
jgi:AI-2 transport protein TqsA